MKRFSPLIILLILSIVACEKRPQGVMSSGKMEDVLYDYHLMQGMIDQLPSDERIEKGEDYINAVFEKHGITQAEFD